MKEEGSIIKVRLSIVSVALMMLAAVFLPQAPVFAETEEITESSAASVQPAEPAETPVVKAAESVETNANVQAAAQTSAVTQTTAAKASAVMLTAPAGVKAKSLGVKTIRIQWKKVAGASGYYIYRATKKNGKYKKIATVRGGNKTSYKNKKRSPGKTYYYKVRAYAGSTVSSYSKAAKGKARPASTTAKAKAGEEKVKVSWKKVSGAHGYHVYRATKKNGKYKRVKVITKGKTTAYTNSGVKGGKTYHYKVRAYKKVDGEKILAGYSEPVSAKAKKVKLKDSKKGFEYKKKFKVKAYAYSGGGRTAMGTKARVGEIAVDPKVIPLGTKVYVEGYGYARAEDTGGNIKGKKIDLYMNSSSACYKWGVREKTIYVDVRKK